MKIKKKKKSNLGLETHRRRVSSLEHKRRNNISSFVFLFLPIPRVLVRVRARRVRVLVVAVVREVARRGGGGDWTRRDGNLIIINH